MTNTNKTCSLEGCEKPLHSKGLCGMHAARQKRNGRPDTRVRLRGAPIRERLWFKTTLVDPPEGIEDECRVFESAPFHFTRNDGRGDYRGINVNGTMRAVHLVAHEEFIGPIPEGYQVHHRCGEKACWNPLHLVAMTPYEHKQRHRISECRREGHSLTDDNAYFTKDGERRCRQCQRDAQRKYDVTMRAAEKMLRDEAAERTPTEQQARLVALRAELRMAMADIESV